MGPALNIMTLRYSHGMQNRYSVEVVQDESRGGACGMLGLHLSSQCVLSRNSLGTKIGVLVS